MVRGSLSKVRLISRHGNSKIHCCSWVSRMARSVRCSHIKARESTDRDLSKVPTDCCCLCMRRGNYAITRIRNDDKSPSMTGATKTLIVGTRLNFPF
ncbi:hypothetical protein AVEN_30638-1 [Araneus ventricosus]|uniref:Uncharacterized protein n=1 Tax=Araneus ventricosus TaxID=182803 RepID=A0A4Y2L3N1_ARAVE|nr:hypothetical protein AVEN_30638-1 [Araneus ventricosus]